MSDPLRPSVETILEAWAERVRGNREQVERLREEEDGPDFYAPIAAQFRADPHRVDDPALQVLRGWIDPDESWLDIGAGGGRYSLPIALQARELIAFEPSSGMIEVLRAGQAEHGIHNIRIEQGRWPADADLSRVTADVAFISHVSYDIEDIGPFVDAMEAAARRLCVAVLLWRQPTALIDDLWPAVHGEPRVKLPSMPEFIQLQLARGRVFSVQTVTAPSQSYDDPGRASVLARRQTWVKEGSEKDRILQAAVQQRLTERGGRYALSWEPLRVGIMTWEPPK